MKMTKAKFILMFSVFFGITFQVFPQAIKNKSESKFVYQTSFGFSNGLGKIQFDDRSITNNIPTFKVQQLLAYQFNNYIIAGVGGGLDIWKKSAFIPLYANLSVNFINRNVTPHWYLNVGYAFKWYVSTRPDPMTLVIHGAAPGPYGETGLGIKIRMSDRLSFIITANYMAYYSQINYSVVEPDEIDFSKYATNRSMKTFYHFVGLKVGVMY